MTNPNVRQFLDCFAKNMLFAILGQRVEGVTKTALANKLKGSAGHP